MGLTIYYCGELHSFDEVDALICDVADICLTLGWRMMPIHPSNIMPGKGIIITPEGCESIWLTFLPNGMLYDVSHFIYASYPENEKVDEHHGQWIFTKTQYAGLDTHLAIIKMFRYLSQRYFKAFELKDESSYWETNDVSACAERDITGSFFSFSHPIRSALGFQTASYTKPSLKYFSLRFQTAGSACFSRK